MDAILALRLLSELHQEFTRPLQEVQVAYVDLKSAFDSVDRQALCGKLSGPQGSWYATKYSSN